MSCYCGRCVLSGARVFVADVVVDTVSIVSVCFLLMPLPIHVFCSLAVATVLVLVVGVLSSPCSHGG